MKFFLRLFFVIASLSSLCLFADEVVEEKKKDDEKTYEIQELARTRHTLNLKGEKFDYDAICGTLPLKGTEESAKAVMYYTAYFKTNAKTQRPLLFCFNGGPGSSSLWLHMGLLGPKKAKVQDTVYTPPPGSYEDNPYTLLDKADLVFIDPVSTGYSKTTPGTDPKPFHSVEGDIDSFADFIRLFLNHFERWGSPRYLVGESYGTLRAVGLAEHLHDSYLIDVNGIALISICLDFQPYIFGNANDLPYILSLPTYAATAWYHKKLAPEEQSKPLLQLLNEVEDFAAHTYATALMLGDQIDEKSRQEVVSKLSRYTGLSPEYIKAAHLRILNINFYHELLKKEGKVIGRFDGRYTGYDSNHIEDQQYLSDPSFDAVTGLFTSAFQQYLEKELNVQKTEPYLVLNAEAVSPWNFGLSKTPAGLGYVSLSGTLRTLLERMPTAKVFVASGYYDLATPYFAGNYSLIHLKLNPALRANIQEKRYEAGHMMYLNPQVHEKMKKDLSAFLQN